MKLIIFICGMMFADFVYPMLGNIIKFCSSFFEYKLESLQIKEKEKKIGF